MKWRGPPGFRLCSDSLQKVEQTERRDNARIMRVLVTEPGGKLCIWSSPWQTSSRVTTRVNHKANAHIRSYVWAAALKPSASWPPIVQAFHSRHRARAITHSSKRLRNRKDSCLSHWSSQCPNIVTDCVTVRDSMPCDCSSLPCRDDGWSSPRETHPVVNIKPSECEQRWCLDPPGGAKMSKLQTSAHPWTE